MIPLAIADKPRPPMPNSPPKILCVDDDSQITRSIELLLSNYEVRVISDGCGRRGVYDVFKHRPELIITDLQMSDGDGQYLLEEVKRNKQSAHIPVIVLTGRRDPHLAGRVRNLGANCILHKPVSHARLMEEIRRYVTLLEIDWEKSPAADRN